MPDCRGAKLSKELMRDVRSHWYLMLLKVAICVALMSSLFIIASFAMPSRLESEGGQTKVYRIVDTLFDASSYNKFISAPGCIDSIADFYNALNATSRFGYLSVATQAIPVVNHRGGETFEVSYGEGAPSQGYFNDPNGELALNVKAVEINKAAFEFGGLTLSDGSSPDWDLIKFDGKSAIPVMLGASYGGFYSVGDTMDAWLYGREFIFEIAGMLEPGSSIYLPDGSVLNLEECIVVPLASVLSENDFCDEELFGQISIAAINGAIVPGAMSYEAVLSELDAISFESGYHEFALLNEPMYFTKMTFMRHLIRDGAVAVAGVGAMLVFLSAMCIVALDCLIFEGRCKRASSWRAVGASKKKCKEAIFGCLAIEALVSAVLAVFCIDSLGMDGSFAFAWCILALIILLLLEIAVSNARLKTRIE